MGNNTMNIKHIVFIHGWASGPYVWLHQAGYFRNKYIVHTPELSKGSGLHRDLTPMFDCMAGGLADFIVSKNLSGICLVGWSLGGMLSLKLAHSIKDRVGSLVLIGTTPRFVKSADFTCAVSKEMVDRIYKNMKNDFHGTLSWFFKFCFSANERAQSGLGEILNLLGDIVTPLDKDTLLAGLKLLTHLDVTGLLDGIRMPALIIQGAKDKVCLPEAARFLAERLNGRLEVIDNAGHAPFLTQPRRVNELIEGFLVSVGCGK